MAVGFSDKEIVGEEVVSETSRCTFSETSCGLEKFQSSANKETNYHSGVDVVSASYLSFPAMTLESTRCNLIAKLEDLI